MGAALSTTLDRPHSSQGGEVLTPAILPMDTLLRGFDIEPVAPSPELYRDIYSMLNFGGINNMNVTEEVSNRELIRTYESFQTQTSNDRISMRQPLGPGTSTQVPRTTGFSFNHPNNNQILQNSNYANQPLGSCQAQNPRAAFWQTQNPSANYDRANYAQPPPHSYGLSIPTANDNSSNSALYEPIVPMAGNNGSNFAQFSPSDPDPRRPYEHCDTTGTRHWSQPNQPPIWGAPVPLISYDHSVPMANNNGLSFARPSPARVPPPPPYGHSVPMTNESLSNFAHLPPSHLHGHGVPFVDDRQSRMANVNSSNSAQFSRQRLPTALDPVDGLGARNSMPNPAPPPVQVRRHGMNSSNLTQMAMVGHRHQNQLRTGSVQAPRLSPNSSNQHESISGPSQNTTTWPQ